MTDLIRMTIVKRSHDLIEYISRLRLREMPLFDNPIKQLTAIA